ncbi:hypothetical protein IB69_005415 [Xanthomonas citri]|nr:hypothetical protein IB69_005415 [Xanthomonas citri]
MRGKIFQHFIDGDLRHTLPTDCFESRSISRGKPQSGLPGIQEVVSQASFDELAPDQLPQVSRNALTVYIAA